MTLAQNSDVWPIAVAQRRVWAWLALGAVPLVEFLVIVAGAIAAGVVLDLTGSGLEPSWLQDAARGCVAAIIFFVIAANRGEYATKAIADRENTPGRIVRTWGSVLSVLGAYFLLSNALYSSAIWLAIFSVVAIGCLIGLDRIGLFSRLAAAVRAGRRLVVVGSIDEFQALRVLDSDWPVAGFLQIPGVEWFESHAQNAEQIDREFRDLVERARVLKPDTLLILSRWKNASVMEQCIEVLGQLPAAIGVVTPAWIDKCNRPEFSKVGASRYVRLVEPPLTTSQAIFKRLLDIVVSSLALAALAPLLVVVAYLIKRTSPGPVFFRQRRCGFDGEVFRMWKFRTMTTLDDGDVIVQAQPSDPRLTCVGAYLRKSNIDELPQLFNVITGEMSLVGPRPHAMAHDSVFEKVTPKYAQRRRVKPGITGWAQVNGLRGRTTSNTELRKRVEFDIEYVDNYSLLFDLYIMGRTFSRRAFLNAE